MKSHSKMQILELLISEYSTKGNGIGFYQHPEGMKWTLNVPFAIPGDYVRVKILRKRKQIHFCQLEEILTPSPDRIKPKCIHFGICGGCRWQQISYEKQLENKQAHVLNCFKDLLNPEVECHPIIGSQKQWAHRNKMEFSFSMDAAKNKFLGLIMDSTKGRVLNITECHLTNDWFVKAVKAVREWWEKTSLEAYHPHNNTGALRTLVVREGLRTGDRLIMLTVSGDPDYALTKQQLDSFVAALCAAIQPENPSHQLSIFLRIQQIAKGSSTNFYEMVLFGSDHIRETLHIKSTADAEPDVLTFNISPTAFFQPNTFQAERLYSRVLQLAQITPQSVVYDLYCGTGTLGICIAKYAKEVISVELSSESALDAKTNAALNHIKNLTVFSGAVRHILNRQEHENPLPFPDIVIVNPPRPGLDPHALKHLLELKAGKVIYVSCNPITQASDIAELTKSGHYKLQAIQSVDQFPQTAHIENIAILVRS